MEGLNKSNSEARAFEKELKNSELNKPTLKVLWQNYLDSKGDSLRGIETDKNRWTNHLKDEFGDMTPTELKPMDIDLLRRKISTLRLPSQIWHLSLISRATLCMSQGPRHPDTVSWTFLWSP